MNTDEMKEHLNLFGEKPSKMLREKARPTIVLGPADKTCKDCKHAVRFEQSKSWHKCLLNRGRWTGGTGTDIRLKDPSCAMFEQDPEMIK